MSLSKVALVLSVAAATAAQSNAQPFSKIVNFGASLTDSGNVAAITSRSDAWKEVLGLDPSLDISLPPSPPYREGRFSSGPTWVDFLADELGVERPTASEKGGTNYAFSGASSGTVPSPVADLDPEGLLMNMDRQVATFLENHQIDGNELFVVAGYIALNDFHPDQKEAADANVVAQNVAAQISDLVMAGAKNVLVTRMFSTPRRGLRRVDQLYSEALDSELASLKTANPETTFFEFDLEPELDRIIRNPAAFGFRNVTGQACNDCMSGVNPFPQDYVPADEFDDYLFFDGPHYSGTANRIFGEAAYRAIVPSPYLLEEDFNDLRSGELPDGVSLIDTNVEQSWGPTIFTAENGALRIRTTGSVQPTDPPERFPLTGAVVLTWDESEQDPHFNNGYLRATIQANTGSDANLVLRGDTEDQSTYLFSAIGPSGDFRAFRSSGANEQGVASAVTLGIVDEPTFTAGQEYEMEVGAVGNRITMKVWAANEEEPELPQLVAFDDAIAEGVIGLVAATSPAALAEPTPVDVLFDDLTFLPSVVGDVNKNTSLDGDDIDRLSTAIEESETNLFLDFNQDMMVSELDRRVWVEELAQTFLGDADLNGAVEFTDFLVLSENFGQPGGWSDGDFDGNGEIAFSDFLALSANFGQVAAVASVPEPNSMTVALLGGLVLISVARRRNGK